MQILNLIKPIASVKKLSITSTLAPDVPEFAVGDEKRLLQVLLNIIGNAVKFTKEGSILVNAVVAKAESLRDSRTPDFIPVATDGHFYLRVQVNSLFLFQTKSVLFEGTLLYDYTELHQILGEGFRTWNQPTRYSKAIYKICPNSSTCKSKFWW